MVRTLSEAPAITNPTTPDVLPSISPDVGPMPTDRAALERQAIEGYEAGIMGLFHVQQFLGLRSRVATENWLGDHGVRRNYSLEDLEDDRRTLARLFSE